MNEGVADKNGVLERLARGGQVVAALVLLVVMAAIAANAIGRYVFGGGLDFVIEISGFLFLAIIFLGLAGALIAGEHIAVDLVDGAVKSRRGKALLRLAVALVSVAFVGAILVATSIVTYRLWSDGSTMTGGIRMPLWPVMALVPVGCALLGGILVKALLRNLGDFLRN